MRFRVYALAHIQDFCYSMWRVIRMDTKICFFTGHSNAPKSVYSALEDAVERHIVEYGVTQFRVGNYGDFDRMALQAVRDVKKRHACVSLCLVLPYWPEAGRILPDLEGIDRTLYPQELDDVPHPFAITRLNRLMVCDATHLIAYVNHSWGGAAKTLEYAQVRQRRGELTITNLGGGLI